MKLCMETDICSDILSLMQFGYNIHCLQDKNRFDNQSISCTFSINPAAFTNVIFVCSRARSTCKGRAFSPGRGKVEF